MRRRRNSNAISISTVLFGVIFRIIYAISVCVGVLIKHEPTAMPVRLIVVVWKELQNMINTKPPYDIQGKIQLE
jgi:hypothetical protein